MEGMGRVTRDRARWQTEDAFLVGSPWGVKHFPRLNYTVLYSRVVDGKPGTHTTSPAAAVLGI